MDGTRVVVVVVVCVPGGGADHAPVCPVGKYSTAPGSTTCTNCLAGTSTYNSGSTTASACISCVAGFYSVAGGACTLCAVGTYSNFPGAGSCTACPVFSTTQSTGSTDVTQCLCNAGYGGLATGGSCTICPAGWYKSGVNNNACQQCPSGYFSAPGSSSCTVCPLNTYSDTPGASCTACPVNSLTATTGSTDITQCVCAPSYSGPAGGPCTSTSMPALALGRWGGGGGEGGADEKKEEGERAGAEHGASVLTGCARALWSLLRPQSARPTRTRRPPAAPCACRAQTTAHRPQVPRRAAASPALRAPPQRGRAPVRRLCAHFV